MGSYKSVTTPEQLVRLWCHESKRVFEDRLINAEDHAWFKSLLQGIVKNTFQMEWDDVVPQVGYHTASPYCRTAVSWPRERELSKLDENGPAFGNAELLCAIKLKARIYRGGEGATPKPVTRSWKVTKSWKVNVRVEKEKITDE